MGRERERIAKQREKDPAAECNKVQQKFYPELFKKFDRVKDPRHQGYIEYSTREMLGTLYYKGIAGISGMRRMTREFNEPRVCGNLYRFMGSAGKDYLPHGVTENEFLERLEPSELEEIQADIAYRMIRRKTFDHAKVLRHWLVLVDGTELDEGNRKPHDGYLSRTYNRGEKNETTRYHRSVLEAKLYLGNGLVCSMATETIENPEEYQRKKMSEEAVKQDCETKAFERLVKKLKQKFPRLPICIVADALYVTHNVIGNCRKNGWEYIIRYKEGSAPSIEEEYRMVPEKQRSGNAEFVNGVVFGKEEVNVLKYRERKKKGGEFVTTGFAWITSFRITEKNAEKLVRAGRDRWKIENQGFNRQKKWQGDIEHACSLNGRAQKNHYLMEQIADFIKQLYEFFYLEKNGIKKEQKNISSELLASFGRHLTRTEDISQEQNGNVLT